MARVAIITGCAQGIGMTIATRLASDGYDLALADLQVQEDKMAKLAEELVLTYDRKVITIFCDVSIENDVESLVHETVVKLGGLDVMIANAGALYLTPITEMDEQMWDKQMSVNVKGTMFCYKHAARQMIKQGRGGRIIGASSTAGKQGFTHGSCYSASKFAVRGLTQCVAIELGQHGVTVNAYAPGPTDTSFLANFDKYFTNFRNQAPGSLSMSFEKATPAGRLGAPEDIAALVSFLVREEASFITGQTVSLHRLYGPAGY